MPIGIGINPQIENPYIGFIFLYECLELIYCGDIFDHGDIVIRLSKSKLKSNNIVDQTFVEYKSNDGKVFKLYIEDIK